jgi:hypothetical protein
MKRSLAARCGLTGKRRNRPGRVGRPLRLELLESREMPSATITTIAGQRTSGFGGDGGPAIRAMLDQPSAVATDARGDLFIIDDYNERVREVTPNGTILTFAGTGIVGDDGDGGPATQATFEFGDGGGLAVDNQGDVFIADPAKADVREVTPNGIINLFAGRGDSLPGQGDGGPATQASLLAPYAVAVDANGDVFIADSGTNTIRKVTPDGIIQTVAGMLSDAVGGPGGFSGDGGPATQANLNQPSDVVVDNQGDLFIVDSGNDRIREVTPDGIIRTIAGNGTAGYTGNGGPATSAELNLNNEGGIAIDANGNLFIADSGNNVIREVSTSGTITTVAGNGQVGYSGDGGPATSATLNNPTGVTVSNTGGLLIADTYNNVVRAVSTATSTNPVGLVASLDSSHVVPTKATDLHLLSFFGGEKVRVPVTVTNAGVQPANGAIDIKLFLSTNPTLDGSAIPAGTLRNQQINLAASAQQQFKMDVTIPSRQLQQGQRYYVIAQVIAKGSLGKSSNNTAVSSDQYEFLGTPRSNPKVFSNGTYFRFVRDLLNGQDPPNIPHPEFFKRDQIAGFVAAFEGKTPYPYKVGGKGNTTIGIGMEIPSVVRAGLLPDLKSAVQAYAAAHNDTSWANLTDKQFIQRLNVIAIRKDTTPIMTMDDVDTLFTKLVARYETAAQAVLDQHGIAPNGLQWVALVDVQYNMTGGLSAFPSMLRALQDGDFMRAAFQLVDARRTTQYAGLTTRTEAEFQNLLYGLGGLGNLV